MSKIKIACISLLIIIGMITIIFATTGLDLAMFKFWAPKYEDARREVFVSTKSYNEAKLQELSKFMFEYSRSTPEDKIAMKSTIRHRFADYDATKLPYQLRVFLEEVRGY